MFACTNLHYLALHGSPLLCRSFFALRGPALLFFLFAFSSAAPRCLSLGCPALLCLVLRCHALRCHTPCLTHPFAALCCCLLPFLALNYACLPCGTPPCFVLPCQAPPCLALPRASLPCLLFC